MGGAAQQADEQREKFWREFGVWLEGEALRRHTSKQAFGKASGINWHTVYDLFNGGRNRTDGTWRVANPTDRTLRRIAKALGLPETTVFERAGGTYRERNPDQSYPGEMPSSERERLRVVEAKVDRVIARNEELVERQRLTEELLRKNGIPIPGEDDGRKGASGPRRRRNPG